MKNLNNINTICYIFCLGILSFLIGCTNNFEAINTNPNSPTTIQSEVLLRQVLYNYGEQMSYEGYVSGGLLSQHFTAIDFNLFDRHALKSAQLGGNPWPTIYKNLRDNELIIQNSQSNLNDQVYEGPALIYKAYLSMALTDLYGDVPYFKAFKGAQEAVTPAYDSQEKIYMEKDGILDQLSKGVAAIQAYNGQQKLNGDIIYNGDLSQWVKFGNALKIKALMRISAKVVVSKELQTLVDENNFINTSIDDAVFQFSNSEPNNFRMARLRVGDFNNLVLSKTFEEELKQRNDPRLKTFFRANANSTDPSDQNSYTGLENGIDASQESITIANYALGNTLFRENSGQLKMNFLTSWEIQFLLAEAASKNFINLDAQTLYEKGVQQAFAYWNTAMPLDYIKNEIAFEKDNALQQIVIQKWIANIINGYEGWIEYRRTGFPTLKPAKASLNDNYIPTRMPYPADEITLNSKAFNLVKEKTNNNSINTLVWWDE